MSKIFHHYLTQLKETPAWQAIADLYGDRTAERSGVPLIRHIIEGLAIIYDYAPGDVYRYEVCQAFCLHPLMQTDESLQDFQHLARFHNPRAVLFATEYRWRANNWLSDKVYTIQGVIRSDEGPQAGDLEAVKLMLIADKVQNYKDFLTYHAETHPRREELKFYFTAWLEHLGIDDTTFQELSKVAEQA